MRFQVPQFIEVEDKVIGPLTFKQFVYLAGGGGLVFLLYKFLPLLFALPLMAAAVGASVSLAFYKVNNKPFIDMVESAFRYMMGARLYIWKKEFKKKAEQTDEAASESAGLSVPKLSDSKLKDLAWSLDVQHNNQQN